MGSHADRSEFWNHLSTFLSGRVSNNSITAVSSKSSLCNVLHARGQQQAKRPREFRRTHVRPAVCLPRKVVNGPSSALLFPTVRNKIRPVGGLIWLTPWLDGWAYRERVRFIGGNT